MKTYFTLTESRAHAQSFGRRLGGGENFDGSLDSSFSSNGFYLPNPQVENGYVMMAQDSDAVYVV
ncbi:MAG: hypothetical protein LH473_00435 [Chitinophagales bacterium]|nr:hypothetical protein [Chitinophagales bacterium]